MVAEKKKYRCAECNALHNKWVGQCLDCGSWNTLIETTIGSRKSFKSRSDLAMRTAKAVEISDVTVEKVECLDTGVGELNRVLGGGLVPAEKGGSSAAGILRLRSGAHRGMAPRS